MLPWILLHRLTPWICLWIFRVRQGSRDHFWVVKFDFKDTARKCHKKSFQFTFINTFFTRFAIHSWVRKSLKYFLRARIHLKITSEMFTQRQQHFLQSYVSIGLSLTRWDFLTVILIGLLNAKKNRERNCPHTEISLTSWSSRDCGLMLKQQVTPLRSLFSLVQRVNFPIPIFVTRIIIIKTKSSVWIWALSRPFSLGFTCSTYRIKLTQGKGDPRV